MSKENSQELPKGWTTTRLSNVAFILMGQSPPSSTYNSVGSGLAFFQGKAEFGALYPVPRVWCSRPGKIAEPDDILLSVRAPVGPTNLAPSKSCIGRGLAAIRPESEINLRYLLHVFRRFAAELDAKGTGTTFKAVSGRVVGEFSLPIAPFTEQQRIAEALDELLSDLDAGVAALERVRAKLAHYRAAVLKAAVEGTLTAEWRQQHPHAEHATELLKRILAERRRRWEEEQLCKFKEKGQESPKNWKAKYKEPVKPNTTNLPPLPEAWCWVTLDQVLWQLRSGIAETSGRKATDYPVLKSSAVRQGCIDFDDVNYLQELQSKRSDNYLRQGDLLITRLSGSVDYVGCCAVVGALPTQGVQYPDRIFCGKLVPDAEGIFVSYCFRHPRVRATLEKAAKSTAGHQRVSLSDLYPLTFPLPALAEQEAIVETVEDQLSIIDHLEADLDVKLKNAQALRQAILRHAFTGQLVPQDPNDEPASELLKRIAAEREERARTAAAAKRTGKQSSRPRATAKPRATKNAKSPSDLTD